MDASGGLVAVMVLVLVIGAAWWSYLQYRRKARVAQAKSRAALNRLLAEADRIERGADADADEETAGDGETTRDEDVDRRE